ncbi:hypothetical protein Tco_1095658, partial [Tanacetum coccineum]
MYKEFNAFNKLESQRFVLLQKELSKSLHNKMSKSIRLEVRKGMKEVPESSLFVHPLWTQIPNMLRFFGLCLRTWFPSSKQHASLKRLMLRGRREKPSTQVIPNARQAPLVNEEKALVLHTLEEKSSEEDTLGKKEIDNEPPAKKPMFLILSSSIPSPTHLKSIMPEHPKYIEAVKMTLAQFIEHLSKTTSSIFSPTPPREPTPLRDESKGKGIATEGLLKDIMPFMEEGGSVPKISSLKSFVVPEGPLSQENVMAQLKEMKILADLKAEKQKSEKVDQLPIIKISYVVNANKEATMKITKGDNPLNLIVYPNFRLKTPGFSEWLEVHALSSKKSGKSNDMLLQSLRAKFQWLINQAKKLGLPPPPALATFRITAEDNALVKQDYNMFKDFLTVQEDKDEESEEIKNVWRNKNTCEDKSKTICTLEVIENGDSWVSVPQTTQRSKFKKMIWNNGFESGSSLCKVEAKKLPTRTGKKISHNANDTAGYDKSTVECTSVLSLGQLCARECNSPRSKDSHFKNQEGNQQIQFVIPFFSLHQLVSEPKFLIKMPPRRTRNINDVYERIMARMDERLDQFVDQFSNRMNDMMNLRRCGDRNGRRSEDEELGNPFFEGDCSSSNEWGDHGVAGDDYEGAPVFDDGYEEAPIFDDDQFEEESMPVYDTDIEDVISEEEENMEDIVVVANDLCSSMIQTTLSVDFSKNINSNPHELIWSQKGNLVEVSILIGKKYQEGYLKAKPMDDKLGFKTIKIQLVIPFITLHQLVSEPKFLIKMPPKRSEGEESEYPFFEGDGSSSGKWKYYCMAGDDYEGPPIFDDDQFDDDYEGPPVFDDY